MTQAKEEEERERTNRTHHGMDGVIDREGNVSLLMLCLTVLLSLRPIDRNDFSSSTFFFFYSPSLTVCIFFSLIPFFLLFCSILFLQSRIFLVPNVHFFSSIVWLQRLFPNLLSFAPSSSLFTGKDFFSLFSLITLWLLPAASISFGSRKIRRIFLVAASFLSCMSLVPVWYSGYWRPEQQQYFTTDGEKIERVSRTCDQKERIWGGEVELSFKDTRRQILFTVWRWPESEREKRITTGTVRERVMSHESFCSTCSHSLFPGFRRFGKSDD